MKKLFKFLNKHHLLCCSPFGLFVALFIGYAAWSYFGATGVTYLYGVTAFADLSLLIYFDWGYNETEPGAFGAYTGTIIVYVIISILIVINAFSSFSNLTGAVSALICALIGFYLIVPIIRFFNDNDWA